LVIALSLAGTGRGEDKDLLALTTNFGPARRGTPVREESVRRQESQIVGQQLIGEGLKLYYDAKYEAAIAKFEQAVKVLPRADATQVDYDRAVRGLSDCYERLADAALRAGDKEKARQYAKKSLEYQPTNRAAENIVVRLKLGDQDTAAKAERAKLDENKPKASAQRPNLDKTTEFKASREEIRKLFREARILTNSGQHDEAEKRYKQILLIDHYNEDAYKNLQELNALRLQAAKEGEDNTRRQRLWQVTEAWIPTVSGEVKLPEKSTAPTISVTSPDREKIERKLRIIRFPEINFRDAAVVDVVKFLSEESAKVDPDDPKEGVNIVLGPGVGGGAAAPTPSPDAAAPAPAAGGGKTITLSLHNVPMDQALKYVCQLTGLRSRVEASAVVLTLGLDEGEMVTRPYNVSPDAIRSLISGASGAAPPVAPAGGVPGAAPGAAAVPAPGAAPIGGASASGMEDLKTFFTNAGVPFPPGSSLSYFERARTIYVRNTPSNLEIFERVLATFSVVPSQVEIEAKFIEITQTDLDELGFQWNLGGMMLDGTSPRGTSFGTLSGGGQSMGNAVQQANTTNILGWVTQGLRGTSIFQGNTIDRLLVGGNVLSTVADAAVQFQGVLNNATVQMVVNALSQKKSADVLSAPKVTTISGAQAQIRVVQEFIYPSEYSQPTIASDSDSPPTPSFPTAFKTREVGVILSVTPTVGSDGSTINLTLVPEVSKFLGMLDYSPKVSPNPNSTIATQQQDKVAYKIWQPLFETRNVTTSVVIWDGQTVVLGGLITEVVDKVDDKVPFLGDVPILGRLFRQKINQRAKRNLLVFVTARLIDPSGNLIHRPETPGFRFDPMGNPIRGPETVTSK
jgi:general secretion pathway protein D